MLNFLILSIVLQAAKVTVEAPDEILNLLANKYYGISLFILAIMLANICIGSFLLDCLIKRLRK